MGYGDFKLFAALGAWLGWQMLLPVILIAAVVGAVVGIAMLSLRGPEPRHADRLRPVPRRGRLADAHVRPAARRGYLGLFARIREQRPHERARVPRRTDRRHRQRQVDGGRSSSARSACRSSTATRSPATSSSPDSRRSSGWWSASGPRSSPPTGTSTGRRCAISCSPTRKARADLEALTHPAIGAALEARSASAGGPYQILVIPLLVEKNLGLARGPRAGGRLRRGTADRAACAPATARPRRRRTRSSTRRRRAPRA